MWSSNTNLAWSKQKSIGWNKLSLNVFAQLKEERLFKMAKDPSRQRENQNLGMTVLHVIIILQAHVQCRALTCPTFYNPHYIHCNNFMHELSRFHHQYLTSFIFFSVCSLWLPVITHNQLLSWFHVWQVQFEDTSKHTRQIRSCWLASGMDRGGSPTHYDLDKYIRNIENSGQCNKRCVF